MAERSGAMPLPGGYWLMPEAMAARASSSMNAGPSVSGKPCPRLTDCVASASADISAKIVAVADRIRSAFQAVGIHETLAKPPQRDIRTRNCAALLGQMRPYARRVGANSENYSI